MSVRRRALVVAVVLACAGLAEAAGPAPEPAAVSPLVAASRAAKAQRASAPPPRKVWTLEDLERLDRSRPGFNVVDMGATVASGAETPAASPAAPVAETPAGVADRYRELLTQADAEIAALQRERLAASNPYLRGMGPEKVRPAAEVDAELVKWRERRRIAARYVGE